MRKFIQQKLKNQKGLTLIELLAVIVILAIIAAIAIPAIGNIINNSRVGAIKSDALNTIAAADLYYADNPEITAVVPISTLAADTGYLKDAASLNTAGTVSKDGKITASGTVGSVTVEFNAATKTVVSGLKNNAAITSGTVAAGAAGVKTR